MRVCDSMSRQNRPPVTREGAGSDPDDRLWQPSDVLGSFRIVRGPPSKAASSARQPLNERNVGNEYWAAFMVGMAFSLSDDPSAATEAEPGALTAARSVRPQSVTTARQASPIALLARSPPHRRCDAAFERPVDKAGKQHTDVAGEVVEPVAALVPLENHVGSAEMCGCATDVAPLHRRPFRGRWRASMTH